MVLMTLSHASLGGDRKFFGKKSYKKRGIRVTRLPGQRCDRNKRYPVCIIPFMLGWYPSKTANFVFKNRKFDPQYLWKMASEIDWNPSVWLHRKSERYVVRVPKDRGKQVWTRLYARGMWYDPATNLWCRRRRRSRKSGYPSFVQSLSAQKKGERICRSKKEKAKKQSLKILLPKFAPANQKNRPSQ